MDAQAVTAPRVPLLPSVALPPGWTNARAGLLFHAAIGVLAAMVLALPAPALGLRVVGIVLAYHIGMLLVGLRPAAAGWTQAWLVLAPLSVLMVLPDWFLSDVLGSLSFASSGAPVIGSVSLFMAGMWVMALFPLVLVAAGIEKAWGARAGVVAAAVAGLALFWAAELLAPVVPLWDPVDVRLVGGVAAYVLPAEIVLSVGTWLVVRGACWRSPLAVGAGVLALPLVYTGALALGYQVLG